MSNLQILVFFIIIISMLRPGERGDLMRFWTLIGDLGAGVAGVVGISFIHRLSDDEDSSLNQSLNSVSIAYKVLLCSQVVVFVKESVVCIVVGFLVLEFVSI